VSEDFLKGLKADVDKEQGTLRALEEGVRQLLVQHFPNDLCALKGCWDPGPPENSINTLSLQSLADKSREVLQRVLQECLRDHEGEEQAAQTVETVEWGVKVLDGSRKSEASHRVWPEPDPEP
jgi:hypothetical protein